LTFGAVKVLNRCWGAEKVLRCWAGAGCWVPALSPL
jgi:hypothetical protein